MGSQARRGGVTDAGLRRLLDDHDRAAAEWDTGSDGYRNWIEAGDRLLATGEPEAVERVVCPANRRWSWLGPQSPGRLRGLRWQDGSGPGLPADNPWGITETATVAEAITQAWAPVAERLPHLIERLTARAIGLAVAGHGGEDWLVYLLGSQSWNVEVDWSTATPDILAADGVSAELIWGGPPRRHPANQVLADLGEPLPLPLRELAKTHYRIQATEYEAFLDVTDMQRYDWGEIVPPNERYVLLGGHPDGIGVMDLAERDVDGIPKVIEHNPNDGLIDPYYPLWAWLDLEFANALLDLG